jgi:hypothetical protein
MNVLQRYEVYSIVHYPKIAKECLPHANIASFSPDLFKSKHKPADYLPFHLRDIKTKLEMSSEHSTKNPTSTLKLSITEYSQHMIT